MAAAEKFRDKPPAGPGDLPSTVAQPIQEESEEEEEVKMSCQKQPSDGCKTTRFSCLVENGVWEIVKLGLMAESLSAIALFAKNSK